MTADTYFLAYWRELNAQRALLGKCSVSLGTAWAAYRHLSPMEAARLLP